MTAHDAINPEQFKNIPLYHGSNFEFNPGDMLTPNGGAPHSDAWSNQEHEKGKYVYTTRAPGIANYAASKRSDFTGISQVYQVEHTGTAENDNVMNANMESAVNSRTAHPVRVIRKVDDW